MNVSKLALSNARKFIDKKGAGGEPDKPPCKKKLTPELKEKVVEFLNSVSQNTGKKSQKDDNEVR